jgi:hypothetical protein
MCHVVEVHLVSIISEGKILNFLSKTVFYLGDSHKTDGNMLIYLFFLNERCLFPWLF